MKPYDPAAEMRRLLTLQPRNTCRHDDGPVLWHHAPSGIVQEPPFVAFAEELHGEEPHDGYYTHWSPLPRWEHAEQAGVEDPAVSTPVDNAESVAT